MPSETLHGSIAYVADAQGNILGTGTYSAHSMVAVRLMEFKTALIDRDWFRGRILKANQYRRWLGYGPDTDTTGYRLIYGESDGIPGLIVDRYHDVFVIQIATAGMEALRETIVELLVELFQPASVVERSDLNVRQEEQLEEVVAARYGPLPGQVEFLQNGCRFVADVREGQKTGFFLDQKELLPEIAKYASGTRVLNLFSYSGAFSVAAQKAGAKSIHQLDSSEAALSLFRHHATINALDRDFVTSEIANVFNWISTHNEPEYDLVIIDPPALIKSRKDLQSGRKAYHFLNRAALRLLADGGILISSSCSQFFTEDDFATTLRRASVQNGIELRLLKIVRQSADHPISFYFPESFYLKTFICRVDR